jgi:hypothetical protein
MNYEERVRVILRELIKMMEGYATPKHLDTQKKQEDEARNIVRLLNQKFPNDTTEEHIRGTMDRAMLKLKEAHKSRTWPTAADISAAVSKSMTSASTRSVSSGPWKPDTLQLNAKRIIAGEPVGEMYIRGKLADKMVEMGLISDAHLQPYLEYLSANNIPARVDPPIS